MILFSASLVIYQNLSYCVFPCSGITYHILILWPASNIWFGKPCNWHIFSSLQIKKKVTFIQNCRKPQVDTYVRVPASASSDQNWRGAEGCNVTTINSSKSELRWLIIHYKTLYCQTSKDVISFCLRPSELFLREIHLYFFFISHFLCFGSGCWGALSIRHQICHVYHISNGPKAIYYRL